jgi:hypothetical protein
MTAQDRHDLEEAIVSYGKIKMILGGNLADGDERQVEFARSEAAEAWLKVQDTLDEIQRASASRRVA